MEKQAKRERKFAEKKQKDLQKKVKKRRKKSQVLDPDKPISLDFLTNPNKE